MHRLSLFLSLLVSVVPSLAAPTPSAPLYTYDGPVKEGGYIVKLQDGADPTGVLGLLEDLADTNTVSQQWNSEFYNAFAGLSTHPRVRESLDLTRLPRYFRPGCHQQF